MNVRYHLSRLKNNFIFLVLFFSRLNAHARKLHIRQIERKYEDNQ